MVWLPMTSSGLGHRLECVQGLCEFALLACQLSCKARPNPSTSSLHSLWMSVAFYTLSLRRNFVKYVLYMNTVHMQIMHSV